MFKKTIYLILFISIISFVSGCEDPVPKDYEKHTIVEALLIVGEPIQNIYVKNTLPLYDSFVYSNSLVQDAKVYIYEGNNEFELKFRLSDTLRNSGYYYPDEKYTVKKNTTYNLKIVLANGKEITGTTTTPDTISWVQKTKKYVQYPLDTINLPDNPDAWTEWTKVSNSSVFYVYALTCLDTFNYGKYLSVPTEELNRRVYPLAKDEKFYREITIYNFLGITKSPLSWQMVKWFGPHRVSIYVPDNNYLKWLMQVFMYGSFNERFYSVNGAIGFFGSASTIQHDFILLKNQP